MKREEISCEIPRVLNSESFREDTMTFCSDMYEEEKIKKWRVEEALILCDGPIWEGGGFSRNLNAIYQ